MKFLLLPTVLLCVTASSVFADSVACSISNQSVPCSDLQGLGTNVTPGDPLVAFTVKGNTITANHDVELEGAESQPSTLRSIDIQFDDTITFNTKPGDLLRITANTYSYARGGDYGSIYLLTSIGYVGTPQPAVQFSADEYCPSMSNCGYWGAIPASGGRAYLRLQGEDELAVSGFSYNLASRSTYAYMTIEQFKADGVTTDPFAAPEPSSIALGAAGLSVLGLFDRYRRRAYRGSYEA